MTYELWLISWWPRRDSEWQTIVSSIESVNCVCILKTSCIFVNGRRFGGRRFGRSGGGVESTTKFLNAFSGGWGGRSTRHACLCAGAFTRSATKVSADAPCAPLSSRCIIIRDPTIVCKHSIIRITSLNKLRDRILIRFTYQKFLIVLLR